MERTDQAQPQDADRRRNSDVEAGSRNINVRDIAFFLAGLAVSLAIVLLTMRALFAIFKSQQARHEPAPASLVAGGEPRLPPEPRLQLAPGHEIHPLDDLKMYRAEEDARLDRYGWVNQQNGTAHIPIDVAKQQYLQQERGVPPKGVPPNDRFPLVTSSGRMVERRNQ